MRGKNILKNLESFLTDERPVIPDIWQEIHDVWDTFHKSPLKNFSDWEEAEGLSGLVAGLGPENLGDAVYGLEGFDLWRHLPPAASTIFLTAFISGIRVGNELAKRRAEKEGK